MGKTITMRVNDEIYTLIKKAADGDRRSISNFIEYATISYITNETVVSEDEMTEILQDKTLLNNLKQGLKEIEEGKYRIVG